MPVYQLLDLPIFPPPHRAHRSGLLAMGGELTLPWLIQAYRQGIFPWFSEGQPILWWCPDPRLVLEVDDIRITRSLRKVLNRGTYEIRMDTAFPQVIHACGERRRDEEDGTWITREMEAAYNRLHELGLAHSVESWYQGELVGGLYGVHLGAIFFGESMFSTRADASKVALVALTQYLKARGTRLIDCQMTTQHLLSMGAHEIPRAEFLRRLKEALRHTTHRGRWRWPVEGEKTDGGEGA